MVDMDDTIHAFWPSGILPCGRTSQPDPVGTFVWAFFAEHYHVTSFDELFRERTGARAAWSACIATSFVLLATIFFSRNDIFPRGLLVCAIVALLMLTILLHAIFRIIWKSRAHLARPTRLLVVGADEFARHIAVRLKRLSFSPCEIVGYVRLPGRRYASPVSVSTNWSNSAS